MRNKKIYVNWYGKTVDSEIVERMTTTDNLGRLNVVFAQTPQIHIDLITK
jgi:hypothetical protein